MKLIESNMQKIIDLCKLHKVKTLAVFGSILTDKFNDNSDIDLLVNFNSNDIEDYVTNYFGLKDALVNLFNRDVDLIEEKGIKNKFFLRNLNTTKQMIYE